MSSTDAKQSEPTEIELNGCDDFHVHLRNENSLPLLVEHASIQVERALVMPNTKPPIVNANDALKYYNKILKYVPSSQSFKPLMSLYLTDNTTPKDIENASKSGIVYSVKLYPKNATTNSKYGINNIKSLNIRKVLCEMEKYGLILCIHGECNLDENNNNKLIDIFERESKFIDNELVYLLKEFPNLKVILEHVTTKKAVDFILNYYKNKNDNVINLAATITAHHLLSNRNDIFLNNRINPHMFCLPILKTETDQISLINAATSGLPYFFGGSDSAPHTQNTKECSHGCAGIYTMYNMISLYAETFDKVNSMNKLNNFLSKFGSDFYGLQQNQNKIKLIKKKQIIPKYFHYINNDKLIPYRAGEQLNWTLKKQIKYKYVVNQPNKILQIIDDCIKFVTMI